MFPASDRLAIQVAPLALLLYFFAGGFFDGWFSFSSDNDVKPQAVAEAIETAFAGADSTGRLLIDGDRLELDPFVVRLYASRGNTPLWGTPADRQTMIAALSDARNSGISLEELNWGEIERLNDRLERMDEEAKEWEVDRKDPRPALLAQLDVLLTGSTVRFADALSGSRVDPAMLFPGAWYAGASGLNSMAVKMALRSGSAAEVVSSLSSLQPTHAEYQGLQKALIRLREAASTWTPIPGGHALAPGERSIRVPYVRGRLAAFGYIDEASAEHEWGSSDVFVFDKQLAGALSVFLDDRGLGSDSLLTDIGTQALNANISKLIDTVEINLERWRWLPGEFGDMHVLVNLPSFELNVRLPADGGTYRNALTMPAIIGMVNAGRWTTPVMIDTLESIVFNPSWSVPNSIQATSLLPRARADSGMTLPMQGFDVFAGGAWVDPTMVDWDAALPGQYRFVQRPGGSNPMGRIKFVMPNDHAIIIHDTNNKGNFQRPVRAFSNGCIQAGDARALAQFILGRANRWNEQNIDAALRRGGEWAVPLDSPVPTYLLYFTAWAEHDGRLRIYNDVYSRDPRVLRALGYEEDTAS